MSAVLADDWGSVPSLESGDSQEPALLSSWDLSDTISWPLLTPACAYVYSH